MLDRELYMEDEMALDDPETDWDAVDNTREQKERMEVENAVYFLSSIANSGHDSKLFVEFMSQEHRTLQQSMTGLMLEWFKYLSTLSPNYYDARNEQSVEVAKKIMAALGDRTYLSYI